jgi:hypothetical protein
MECAGFERAGSEKELEGASERVRRVLGACVREESARAIAVLDAVVAKGLADGWSSIDVAGAALDTVIRSRLVETRQSLRAIERTIESGSAWQLRSIGPRLAMALRALGDVPLKQYLSDHPDQVYFVLPLAERREEHAAKITVGMQVSEVSALLGSPDAKVWDVGRALDFDIDGNDPFTLRVEVNQKGDVVARVSIIRPLAFLHDRARMAAD